ncbi:DinB family protein [Crossiella cryophila]|uniref:Putative damage-inducible protein DinB n=2 Tax=Crossiella cryophila TaxID=43355 RepID=A0A7W7FSY6_9PSEU|nr:putative damage-inducible protein DinB [Crossiella cryophila]
MAMVREVADERDALLAFLAEQRAALRRSVLNLTEQTATSRPLVSELTLAGLVKHVAGVERNWLDIVRGVHIGDRGPVHALGPGETVAQALAELAEVAARTEDQVRELDLDQPVDVGLQGHPLVAGKVRTVRWVLLHLITELARHAGHADLLRESLDGATAFQLVAAAGDPLIT